jgi:hypothetical protein
MIPALPFLAVGLAVAYRRAAALTLALAIPSVAFMVVAALTFPLIGENGTAIWVERWRLGSLEHTLLTAFGVREAWVAIAPVLLAVLAALVLAVVATPRTRIGDVRPALAATLAWAIISIFGPELAGDFVVPLDGDRDAVKLVVLAAGASVLTLLVLRYFERRAERAGRSPGPEPVRIS